MRKSWLLFVLSLGLFGLLVSACGSDDASGDNDETQTQSDSDDMASEDGSSSDNDSSGASDDEMDDPSDAADPDLGSIFAGDCSEAVRAFTGVSQAFAAAFMPGSDTSEASNYLKELADAAPDEIADAFETYESELGEYFDAIAGLNLSGGVPTAEQAQELTELSESVDDEAVEAASEEISQYFATECSG